LSPSDWDRLSEWHNAWLEGDAAERRQLRTQLATEQPGLIAEADALVASSAVLPRFLQTPALMVAAHEIARETVTLSAGDRVGPYQIVGLLAHGGMGDVYRATDIRLHRDVALKMLAHAGMPDSGRIDRFLQEARITAGLDHPNIIKVFDVGMFHGRPYIVVELLDGETLRGRLAAGAASVSDARRIAADIARGLIAAHAAGLVHRDLKPENVFLTKSGTTKILDFGIAKLVQQRAPEDRFSTLTGVLLGTTGYLAPEQIQGSEVDCRADLFALGAILYETLTGQRAFGGAHTVDALHAILHDPAPSVVDHRDDVPATLVAATERLLEKRPEARFQSAADLVWTLDHLDTSSAASVTARPATAVSAGSSSKRWLPWTMAAIAVAAVAVAAIGALRRGEVPVDRARPLTQFTWRLRDGMTLDSAAVIAPDQQRVVFVGREASGARLFVRDLASLDAAAIPGTDGAKQPFWSPDGRYIGFFARGKLMKVAVQGGSPVALADADDARGGTWSQKDVIVFQPGFRDSEIFRVSASGGPVERVTQLAPTAEHHRYPVFLPDGVHFVYHVISTVDERRGVYVASIDGTPPRASAPLFRSDVPAIYVADPNHASGFLLSAVNERIEARPFDAATLRLTGELSPIAFPAGSTTARHEAMLSASPDVLAFSGPVPFGQYPASVARDGRDLRLWPAPEITGWMRLSPDGTRLMRTIVDSRVGNPDIWVEDLARGTRVRVTTSSDLDVSAVWSPDGRQVAFRSGKHDAPNLSVASADGTGIERIVPCPGTTCEPTDWSSDGLTLLVNVDDDVWTFPMWPGGAPQALLDGKFVERDARWSPDGRWIAYVSAESGRPEVSLRNMTGPPRRQVVSSSGGDQPVWGREGRELLYVGAGGQLYSVSSRTRGDGNLTLSAPAKLDLPPLAAGHWGTTYDVSADGQRVYFPHPGNRPSPQELGIVLNWTALLR
jgi:Tol biopolymer transport system component